MDLKKVNTTGTVKTGYINLLFKPLPQLFNGFARFTKVPAMLALLSIMLVAGCKKEDENPSPGSDAAPLVIATSPSNNASSVARNKVIVVVFSQEMDALTLNTSTLIVKQGTSIVAGTVNSSGTTASFTPTALFTAGLVYTVMVTTGVKSDAGKAMLADSEYSFTAGSATSTLNTVELGTAGDYVILAKTAINNGPTSNITGDLGLSPAATSYITGLSLTDATGYATSSQVTGKVFAADMAAPTPINLTTAIGDMNTAYNDAAGRPTPDFLALNNGNLGGKTLTPGLYKWTTNVTAPTNFTISGGANDIWIFQVSGNLSLASAVNITLIGGAQAKNIFWQVAGTVTIGTTAKFKGIILSKTGITLQTGATLNGRALAQTAVILAGNTVTTP
ncbi:MAG: large protein [Chitinophagaceae bacterium]|nr:large protein [Chitinophagaceae bacterium]